MKLNNKALPKIITKPLILFVRKSYGDTIYLVEPSKDKLYFLYTEEESGFFPGNEGDKCNIPEWRNTTMRWHWIVSGKIPKVRKPTSPQGKILHWEYL